MRGRLITAALLVVVGLVWIGQGLGLLQGTGFMVDDTRWALIGLVAVVLGLFLTLSANRSGRRGG